MFIKGANRLTNSLVNNGVISESDFELYSFGFEMGFAIVANILTTLVIGLCFRMPLESLVFLAAFIPLRSYIGGFHAANHLRCYILSNIAVIAVLASAHFVTSIYNDAFIITTGLVCLVIIFFLAPVQDANRPLEDIEFYVFRRRARIILCAEALLAAILFLVDAKTTVSVLLCTFALACISVCAGAIKICIHPVK